MNDIYAPTPSEAWAATSAGLYRWTVGTNTFSLELQAPPENFQRVTGCGSDVWASGIFASVMHRDDAGAWAAVPNTDYDNGEMGAKDVWRSCDAGTFILTRTSGLLRHP